MSAFEQLHPAVQHHIVNSLQWHSLRPLQEQAIEPVLAGHHALLLAPTAGGKTEAALFPLFSRLLAEDWRGLSLLYLCPIKALLNNLEHRLSTYAGLFGRRVAVWHGDIRDSQRRVIRRDPPDILLTTPESLEVMLVSRQVDQWSFFNTLRAVVVDEIHAFAGDDRGWHLLALLERLSYLGRATLQSSHENTRTLERATPRIQRIGLSATVGNPDTLLDWLCAGRTEARTVVFPPAPPAAEPDIQLDYVGSVSNAALVISRLHRGEKRLVFCDSRSQAENLAAELRTLQVTVFVSHSSLSREERLQAESAFAVASNCVIVATSTLELGIDVGDLDRVIQLESPYTVASFLQRLGRTGRRAGSSGNCLFLAVTPDGFLRALGLLHLWRQGYVEPITPPAKPFHVLVQQLLALILQENSVGHHTWQEWLGAFLRISGIMHEESEQLIDYMLTQGFLWEDNGILGIGSESEKRFGGKNYLTLFTVFLAPPLFMVLYGRVELGQVHPISFVAGDKQPITLALAGKFWAVKWIDWNNRRVYVDPSEQKGRSRWLGTHVQGLHFHLCRAIPLALLSHDKSEYLSQRARTMAEELCDDWAWLDERDGTWLVLDDSGVVWWNFAGYALNSASAKELRPQYPDLKASEFCLSFPQQTDFQQIKQAILAIPADLKPHIDEQAAESLKFSECLPALLLASLLLHRFKDDVPAQNNWRQELFLVKTKKILAI